MTLTREPGGTPFGELARALVLQHALAPGAEPVRVDETAELLLFAAARAQLVDALIRPALARGEVVLCDRFSASTVAYQGHGRGVPAELVQGAIQIATRGLAPDLTLLLDLPPQVGLARRLGESAPDQIERETLAFHERVRAGFLAQAQADPARWLALDATAPPETIAAAIWARVAPLVSP